MRSLRKLSILAVAVCACIGVPQGGAFCGELRSHCQFKTTLYLPPALWKAVKIAAIESDRDATELVVEALQQYLKKGSRS
jgi:hypothetical protein